MGYAGLPGGAIDGLMKRDFAPAADRLRSVIARERRSRRVYAAARANLKNPPKEFTDLAIRMAKGSVGFFESSVATWAKDAAAATRRCGGVRDGQRRRDRRDEGVRDVAGEGPAAALARGATRSAPRTSWPS